MLVSFCHFTTTMTAAVSVSYFYLFIYFNGELKDAVSTKSHNIFTNIFKT